MTLVYMKITVNSYPTNLNCNKFVSLQNRKETEVKL